MATVSGLPDEGVAKTENNGANYNKKDHKSNGPISYPYTNNVKYNNNLNPTNEMNTQVPDNLKSVCKLKKLFLKKSSTLPNSEKLKNYQFKTLNVDNLQNNNYFIDATSSNGDAEISNIKVNARRSFHQDAEEALNSLLWQPYEYQNKHLNVSLNVLDDLSPSDLRFGNNEDLHLGSEMVNNLHDGRKARDESETFVESRDGHSTCTASRLRATFSCSETSRRVGECSLLDPSSVFDSEFKRVASYGYGGTVNNCGDMQVTQNSLLIPQNINITSVTNRQEVNATQSYHNARSTAGAVPVQNKSVYNVPATHDLKQSIPLFQQNKPAGTSFGGTINKSLSSGNLSKANVVGLPNHPRQASTPVSSQRNHQGSFPLHLRNASEPSTVAATNQFRYNVANPISTANIVPIQHQRQNSQTMDGNLMPPRASKSLQKSEKSTKSNASNVSNVNVNFYRAVPVNVVSSVPTIKCLNTLDVGNNVSNVQIMPLSGNNVSTGQSSTATSSFTTAVTQVTVHNSQTPPQNIKLPTTVSVPPLVNRTLPPRTFTSTEAQTDEITISQEVPPPVQEPKRREKRERRQNRRSNLHNRRFTEEISTQTQSSTPPQNNSQNGALPDILDNHLPPPYSPLPNNQPRIPANVVPPLIPPPAALVPSQIVPPPGSILTTPSGAVLQTVVPNNVVPNLVPFPTAAVVTGQVPLMQSGPGAVPATSGFRFPFPSGGFRRGRFSEEPPKGCCGILSWKPGSLRWFIALIALVAICCVLVGTALGAMRPAGRDHLTVSLLMIGVGIVLVTVSGVAWRLTSHDHASCRSMLGIGSTESVDVCSRRFVPRLPPSYGRPHHPYAAMMYPEFQYRPPPPSYQASMQEYRLRLLLLDRGNAPQVQPGVRNAVSPPPTYRSHAGSLLRAPLSARRETAQSEYSCPPSYRSQNSMQRPGANHPIDINYTLHPHNALHSREQSFTLSESNQGDQVNVVNILTSTDQDLGLDNITLDSLKMEPETDLNPLKVMLKGSSTELDGTKDGNLVTIVQTGDHNPVIVTVSGSSNVESSNCVQRTDISNEMEILAHL